MPVSIVAVEEKLEHSIDGSKFIYRRILTEERGQILDANTMQGKVDDRNAVLQMLELCLKGWENLIDAAGNALDFKTEYIRHLPEDVLSELIGLIGASSGKRAADRKK